jgi:transposase
MKGAIHEGDYHCRPRSGQERVPGSRVAAAGAVVIRRQVRRAQVLLFFSRLTPCLIGIEACAGAHYWARELAKLGHEVRLIPPSYVKPFVKRGKTDAADAEAICTAVTAAHDALRAGQDRGPAGRADAAIGRGTFSSDS